MKKKIVLGVTGCIAAYKAADLARRFIKSSYMVNVIMTGAATKFITPLTFESLTGNKVTTDIFEEKDFSHLKLASEADLIVVAPATANFLAKANAGLADNALTTVFLAVKCPKVIAPAMNYRMYENPLTQQNVKSLEEVGVVIVPPEKGELACGDKGTGRLAKIKKIFDASINQLTPIHSSGRIKNKKFLVTAGGTREKIDDVRCLTNLSSGKAGHEIAARLAEKGAKVTLVTSFPNKAPSNVKTVDFSSYNDLREVLEKNFKKTDCLIMAAAVSDFTPVNKTSGKIKKAKSLEIKLEPTGDLLSSLAKKKNNQLVVGFAAESEQIEKNAMKKLKEKALDLVIANDISKSDSGIGSNYADFMVLYPDGKSVKLGRRLKNDAAVKIVDIIEELI